MPLSETVLKQSLINIADANTSTEPDAISVFVSEWSTYFSDATVGAIPVAPGSLVPAETAMAAALVGIKLGGPTSMQSGIIAWWGAVAAAAAAIFPGHTPPVTGITPPPGLAGIANALFTVAAANIAASLGREDACAALAAVLHPLQLGGIAAVAPPPGTVPVL